MHSWIFGVFENLVRLFVDLKAGSHESISDPILLKFKEVTDANQHFYELTSLKREPWHDHPYQSPRFGQIYFSLILISPWWIDYVPAQHWIVPWGTDNIPRNVDDILMMYLTDLHQVMIWNVWLSLFKMDHGDYSQGDRKYDDPMYSYRVTGM